VLTRPLALLAGVAAAAALLTGCASTGDEPAGVQVVASTNVYGDLVSTIGGSAVNVTSIIDDPSKDPHEYEASARTQLAVSKADLVVRNGGGYDDFIDTLVDAANDEVPIIDAVELSGLDADATDFNEHVWYDYRTMAELVDAIADELGALDPQNAEQFAQRAAELRGGIDGLAARAAELSPRFAGTGVAITEPVPLFLLEALGLVNRTPPAFSEAVEDDTDVPAAVMRETLELFSSRSVALLVYNPQTGGPQTDEVLAAADDVDVAAVAADELLPAGGDYVGWQGSLIDDIESALGG
jgi:zinc/manganese transport system substrate-binding protein